MIESIFFNPWIWIIPIILVILLAAVVAGIVWEGTSYDADGFGIGLAIFTGLISLVLGGIYFAFILPPYDGSFYQTYRITGEVTTLERAFNADDGGGLSQSFVLGVEGVDLMIQSNDQRLRTVDVGDDVTLVCGKSFEYFVEPWYQCSLAGK